MSRSTGMPTDPKATPQLIALYERLKAQEGKMVMFGQQDGYVCGATVKENQEENIGKTDISNRTGKYAAVAGFDIGHYEVYYVAQRDPEFAQLIRGKDRTGGDFEPGMNIDTVSWEHIRQGIQFAHEKGAVVTISWHSVNPLTGAEYGEGNRTWTKSLVKEALPGGSLHARFNLYLDSVLEFNSTLTDRDGNLIPYIFRPFHEHSGDWFWWCVGADSNPNDGTAWSGDGGRLNDPEDLIALYRYTVQYLQEHGMHNVLYCISPDMSRIAYEGEEIGYNEAMAEEWLIGYPGDDVIDLFGLDNYWNVGNPYNTVDRTEGGAPVNGDVQYKRYAGALETLSELAARHGKLAALTEMGLASRTVLEEAGRPFDAPYTEWFLKAVKENERTRRILYGLVWRSDFQSEDADPFVPWQCDYSAKEDFQKFLEDEYTYFI